MMRNTSLATLLLLLVSASPAWAAEGGLLSVSGGLIFWTIVTFVIVLVVLGRYAFPHILGAVEARERRLIELQEATAQDREEAARLLEEQKQRMEEVRTKAQEAISEARTAAERIREDMLAEARREQEALLARAARDIEGQLESALETLREEAVELALAAASRLVERNLDDEANRRLVEEFLAELDARGSTATAAGV